MASRQPNPTHEQETNMLRLFTIGLLLGFWTAGSPLAGTEHNHAKGHEDHEHTPGSGPNGGTVEDLGPYHAELVVKGDKVVLILQDHGTKTAANVEKLKATLLTIDDTDRKPTITLSPIAGGRMEGTGAIANGANARAIVTLTLADGKPVQAKFALK
jgi:hypothetical protein